MTRTNIGQASPISVFIQSASISLAASHNATHRRKTICAKNSPVQDLFLIQCLTVFGFGGETETETESQPLKPKPILNIFATETENLKPIDKNELIIVQYEKSETTKKNRLLFLLYFLFVSKNSVCKRLRSFEAIHIFHEYITKSFIGHNS